MQSDEAKATKAIAIKAFGPAANFLSPKTALVAVVNGAIVGGLLYKIKTSGKQKVGYIDYLFTDPAFAGQGIAGKLCDACFAHLWQEGCKATVAYVQDDNAASWKLFVKKGFVLTSYPKMIKGFGLMDTLMIKLFSGTFGFAVGYDFYVAFPDKEETLAYQKSSRSFGQMVSFMLVNLLTASYLILTSANPLNMLIAGILIFAGMLVMGYVGTLFSKHRWHFRLNEGGVFLPLNFMFLPFVPLAGAWYPKQYENTPAFRKDIALQSLTVWVALLVVGAMRMFIEAPTPLLSAIFGYAGFMLVLRSFPVVLTSYGSARVLKWNKLVYIIFAALSIYVAFFL